MAFGQPLDVDVDQRQRDADRRRGRGTPAASASSPIRRRQHDEDQPRCQLDERVARADRLAAVAAPPAQQQPAEHRDVVARRGSAVPHAGQCDGGRTTDSPRGTRQMTTLRNEPMTRPRRRPRQEQELDSHGRERTAHDTTTAGQLMSFESSSRQVSTLRRAWRRAGWRRSTGPCSSPGCRPGRSSWRTPCRWCCGPADP